MSKIIKTKQSMWLIGLALIFMCVIIVKNNYEIQQNEKVQQVLYETYAKNYRVEFSRSHNRLEVDTFRNKNNSDKIKMLHSLVKDMKTSNTYYEFAETLEYRTENYGLMYKLLIFDYIAVLERYMMYEMSDKDEPFEYDIEEVLSDILLIGEWLKNNSENSDKVIHSDDEFFKEIFPDLCEKMKINSTYYNM